MSNIYRCKCIIIGDSTVGKSSIVNAVFDSSKSKFSKKYLMTTDISVLSKKFPIPNTELTLEVFIYDCPGKSYYFELIRKLCVNTNISLIVAVFDVTNEQSFHSLQRLLTEISKTIPKSSADSATIGVILGNKADLSDYRIVSVDDGIQLAKKFKMRYYDCSAKHCTGIDDAFLHLITNWHENYFSSIK